ncbi:MAG: LPS export ABC transporter periplasmic protein LptC [Xanthomonadaceae bacterium]|jgi:lipopolysaccharide export system protein LptC|nr:LPS export ABC transporter periplasmic protein LptC [Xanthomonadaceae bacterium]
MNWRTGLGIALLIAAIVSAWLAWKLRKHDPRIDGDEQRSDYIVHDFEMTALDKEGKESVTLRGPELRRGRDDQTFDIVTPLFLLPDGKQRHWELRADTGWVSADGSELRLRGHVAGDSPGDSDIAPATFRTDTLTVLTQQHLAFTSDRITVSQPGIMQTGIGFEAELENRHYRILSQVNVRYEPSARR